MITPELIAKVRKIKQAVEWQVSVFDRISSDDLQDGGGFVGLHECISAQGTLRAAMMNLTELLAKLEKHQADQQEAR